MASNYWSSTTNANNTDNAWIVNFNNGNVNNNNKSNNNYVRAVRAGKCSLLSFRAVHDAYLDCRRRKRGTVNAVRFEYGLLDNLFSLASDLQRGVYRPSRSVCFIVKSPKLREVFAADFRDRIVHHLVVRELEKYWEPRFIHDSYACRMHKGVHAAVLRLQSFMRKATLSGKRPAWFVQLDVRSFFPSIDKNILFDLLRERIVAAGAAIADGDVLVRLLETIVFHDCTKEYLFKGDPALLEKIPPHKTLFKAPENKGLPIGNLTSQFFANAYLHELDLFVKQTLKCRFYLRYVDDFILLSHEPGQLTMWRERIEAFLRERLALALKPSAAARRVSDGADFLGYIVRPDYLLCRNRVVNNMKAELARFRSLMITEEAIRGDTGTSQSGQSPKGVLASAVSRPSGSDRGKLSDGRSIQKLVMQPETVDRLRQTMASYLGHFAHARTRKLTASFFEKNPWLKIIFYPHNGKISERLRYKGCFRSLKAQVDFFRQRLPGYLLLFEVGAFVELYDQDARFARDHFCLAARDGVRKGMLVAGFPRRMLAGYTRRALSAGYNFAFIAENGPGKYVRERYVREMARVEDLL